MLAVYDFIVVYDLIYDFQSKHSLYIYLNFSFFTSKKGGLEATISLKEKKE